MTSSIVARPYIGPLLQAFFTEYLRVQKRLSEQTIARVLVQGIVIGMSQIWNGSSSGNEPLLLAAGVDLAGESIEGCA